MGGGQRLVDIRGSEVRLDILSETAKRQKQQEPLFERLPKPFLNLRDSSAFLLTTSYFSSIFSDKSLLVFACVD